MDQETRKRWRGLHLRVACGETLSGDEEAFYQAGLKELEQGEPIGAASMVRLKELRQTIAALEAERAELLARGRQVDSRIAVLEAALKQRAKELLGTGD